MVRRGEESCGKMQSRRSVVRRRGRVIWQSSDKEESRRALAGRIGGEKERRLGGEEESFGKGERMI